MNTPDLLKVLESWNERPKWVNFTQCDYGGAQIEIKIKIERANKTPLMTSLRVNTRHRFQIIPHRRVRKVPLWNAAERSSVIAAIMKVAREEYVKLNKRPEKKARSRQSWFYTPECRDLLAE